MSSVTKTVERGQEVLTKIVKKCQNDESFKTRMITDPVSAIEEFTGQKYDLPEGKQIRVIDQTDSDYIYVNIPATFDVDELELTDEELEQVAGGLFGIDDAAILAGLAACAIYSFGCGIYDGLND